MVRYVTDPGHARWTLAPVLNTGCKRVLEQRQAEDSFRKVCKSTRSLIAGLGGNLGIVKIESRQLSRARQPRHVGNDQFQQTGRCMRSATQMEYATALMKSGMFCLFHTYL